MFFGEAFGLVQVSSSPNIFVKAMNVIGQVSMCSCKGSRLVFLGRPSASVLLIVLAGRV